MFTKCFIVSCCYEKENINGRGTHYLTVYSTCIHAHAYMHTHTRTRTRTHTHTWAHTHMHKHKHTHTHTRTHRETFLQTCVLTLRSDCGALQAWCSTPGGPGPRPCGRAAWPPGHRGFLSEKALMRKEHRYTLTSGALLDRRQHRDATVMKYSHI